MGAIRKLYASEIECRVAQCGQSQYGTWCTLLLYKDARVDMRILDEVYGPLNWQREHTMIGDRLYCTISIFDEQKGVWVKKQDVGTESNAEPEKGQASDAFKRAGFNVGIGRELYTAPVIRFNLNEGEYRVDKDSKGKDRVSTYAKFDVKEITYDGDGSIKSVVIVDEKGNIRFPKQAVGKTAKTESSAAPAPLSAPKTDKPIMHQNHENWLPLLQSILSGQATLEQYKKKYYFPEADEIAAKDWLLRNQS